MNDEKENGTTSSQQTENDSKGRESARFYSAFTQYANSIDALRQFFSRLNPFVIKMQKGIVKEKQAYVKEVIRDFGKRASDDELDELRDFLEGLKPAITQKDSKVRVTKVSKIESPLVAELAIKILKFLSHSVTSDIHRKLLNRSILMSLVSYFEVLVADLAHAFYRIAPDAVSTNDKVVSVNELKQFTSLDEALRSVVSRRVDELLWGTVSDWQVFFQSRMKVDLRIVVPNWAQWVEYFQRRHIILHAGSRATERYLSNVDWEKVGPDISQPSLGDGVQVDDVYLENAINAFEVSGLLLCQEVWKKLLPGNQEERHTSLTGLSEAVYRRLLSAHWYVAERLAAWGEQDSEATEGAMLVCKFNRWLCIKRQGRWAEVVEQCQDFDCSAKHRKFALARASLLEDVDGFFELLPKALGTDITFDELREWPILEEMRVDPRFEKVIEEAKQEETS